MFTKHQDMFLCSFCKKEFGDKKTLQIHVEIHPSKIFDWLYLGSYYNATNKKELEEMKTKYILNCASECKNLYEDNITYQRLDLQDHPGFDIVALFQEAIEFINNALSKGDGSVLVHCQLGKSRSSAVIIAYLIKEMKYTTDEAYKFLKKKRQMIMPNLGFMHQLRQYEASLPK